MRYINDDKMPKKARRVAAKISEDELWELMQDVAKTVSQNWRHPIDIDDEYGVSIAVLQDNNVEHDLDIIDVDGENFTCDEWYGDDVVSTPLLGLRTLDNGFTFFGFEKGGDWEYPVFGIIYYDGETLRGYYPSCGNMINLDFNCAFGSEECDPDYNPRASVIIDKYKKFSWYTDDMMDDEGASEAYAKKYDMSTTDSNYGYNWELIEEDIKTMFKLK